MSELFAQVQQVPQLFQKLVTEQTGRLQSFGDEAAKLEGKLLENATVAVDETAKQVKAGLTQVVNLSAEARRQALEATLKLANLFVVRA